MALCACSSVPFLTHALLSRSISLLQTGLDAATTYDVIRLLGSLGRVTGAIRLVSLLQPPPETVALFDELILIDSGRVIYSGPLGEVVPYFESLGYFVPDSMDVADWLQVGSERISNVCEELLNISDLTVLCLAVTSRYQRTKESLSSKIRMQNT